MVRIVDGEILQDDDPRLRVAPRASPVTRPAGPSAPSSQRTPSARGTAVFDWSAPPVRVAHEDPADSFYGLPGLDIFGAHFASKHLVALAAVTAFFGWRGLLVGGIAWAVYKSNIGIAAQQAVAVTQQGTEQGVSGAVSGFFNAPPAGTREYRSGHSAGPAPSGGTAARQSGWSAPGRGHKLGS